MLIQLKTIREEEVVHFQYKGMPQVSRGFIMTLTYNLPMNDDQQELNSRFFCQHCSTLRLNSKKFWQCCSILTVKPTFIAKRRIYLEDSTI